MYCIKNIKNDIDNNETKIIYKTRDIYYIFDEKFKNFIKELKKNINLVGLEFNTNIIEITLKTQEEIRNYIINNENKINKVFSYDYIYKNKFPEIFAVMICILVNNIDIYNSFQEVIDNVKRDNSGISLISNETEYNNEKMYCACGHLCCPDSLYTIYGDKYKIIIGDSCALKYDLTTKEILKNLEEEKNNNNFYKKAKANKLNKIREEELKKIEEEENNFKILKNKIEKELNINEITEKLDAYMFIAYNIKNNDFIYSENFYDKIKYNIQVNKGIINTYKKINICDICNDEINIVNVIMNNKKEILFICCKCINLLKIPKDVGLKGICDSCGIKHRRKKNNLCNLCKEKETCIKCNKLEFLYKNENINYKICKNCFNNLSNCKKCNKEKIYILYNKKYCYNCYNELPNCKICKKKINNINAQYCNKCFNLCIYCKEVETLNLNKKCNNCNLLNLCKLCDIKKVIDKNNYCYECYKILPICKICNKGKIFNVKNKNYDSCYRCRHKI